MTEISLSIPDFIRSFSVLSRRVDIPKIQRFEAHVSHEAFTDSLGRGCGDVWGHGYSDVSLEEALEFAITNCLRAKAQRLDDCNRNLTYAVPKLETPAKALDGKFAGISLDL